MTKDKTKRATAVAGEILPPQVAEIRDLRSWVEPSVGTDRMLTRLAESEPTTVWFRLWDKVWSERNLLTGFWSVGRNGGAPGVDGQTVEQFDRHVETELQRLGEELRDGTYRRQPANRVWISKPGSQEKRPLGIPTVRDRTVEAALRNVIEPIFEHDFSDHGYGFRPGRGCREAVAAVEQSLRQDNVWCVDVDLKSYFDTLPHDRLMALVRQRIADGSVLALLEQCLKAGVLEEGKKWQPTERGTPQGAVISPLRANLYLHPPDKEMEKRGGAAMRYADDLVVPCRTREEAEGILTFLRDWTETAGLTLHPTKTRIVNAMTDGFDFLGWHFRGLQKWPRRKSVQKLREKLRPLTRRLNGRSLEEIIARANPIPRGWRNYFRDSHRSGLSGPDGWLRRRLRAMLRKRRKRRGFGKSKSDSKQWPNRWFAARGLFSLEYGSYA